MKKQTITLKFFSLLIIALFFVSNNIIAQQWAWMSGSSEVNDTSVFGVQGVADAANVPGARNGNNGWVDDEDNIWTFGGFGYATDPAIIDRLNDLWKYDPSSGEWTWMKGANVIASPGNHGTLGIPSDLNEPSSRNRAQNWKDQDGNFWLFGGLDYTNSRTNDLWKYNVSTNQWTWMKGANVGGAASVGVYGTLGVEDAANTPGGRNGGYSWVDSDGNLWLFGGFGYATVDTVQAGLNDLWKYDISSNNWTWMGGSNINNDPPLPEYGEFRVSSPSNDPGSRVSSAYWTDNNGDFWLFGGLIGDFEGRANDLWQYSVSNGEWTWMDGDSIPDQEGQINLDDPANPTEADNPGGRNGTMGWTDNNNNLWLVGGFGFPVLNSESGFLSDTWMYNTSDQLWYFINGALVDFDQQGIYGTQGVPDPNNFPTSRVTGAANMTDSNGDLWMHGGNFMGKYNDLWRLSGIVTSFNEIFGSANELDLNVTPNPNNGSFSLEYKEGERYEVFDAFGRLIVSEKLENDYFNNEIFVEKIELQNLVPGIYFARIHFDGKIGTTKFLVGK